MLRKPLALLLSTALAASAWAAPDIALPELGSAGAGSISRSQEAAIGRDIVSQLYQYDMIVRDPQLQQYIRDLGFRLVGASDTGSIDFHFYVIDDDSINAFALPGGHIGIHTGLIRRTSNEAELAGVVAHEIAHVTQRHIARRFEESQGIGLKGLATLLGAIAVAAAGGGPDAVGGTLMLGQGLIIQDQINFTRGQEYEADRIGIELLHAARFDPQGMISFFETMQRLQRIQGIRLPEYFSTHPLGTSRVVEATQRARLLPEQDNWESRLYPLMKAKLDARARNGNEPEPLAAGETSPAQRFGKALEWMKYGEASKAVPLLADLVEEDDSVIPYHLELAQAQAASGQREAALATIDRALELFPESIPVGIAFAGLQRDFGSPSRGLRQLRRLFDHQVPDLDSLRLMAQLAAESGEQAESHYYLGEFYIRQDDLSSARMQLQLARDAADLGSNERRQYEARLDEVAEALERRRSQQRRRDDEQDGDRRGGRGLASTVY